MQRGGILIKADIRQHTARPLEPVLGGFTIRYLQFGITP